MNLYLKISKLFNKSLHGKTCLATIEATKKYS